jgi:hypothetical protein
MLSIANNGKQEEENPQIQRSKTGCGKFEASAATISTDTYRVE